MLNAKTFTVFYDGWPQSSPWGVCLWAAACGLFAILSMVVSYFAFGKKNGLDLEAVGVKLSLAKLGKTILLSAIVICVSFGCVFFTDYFFKADFRIWVLAVKTFNADKIAVAAFPYAVFFLIYYVGNSVALNCFNYNNIGGKRLWVNTAIVAVAAVLPAVVLLLLQYVPFFAGGDMMFRSANMQVVWLFPMLVVLPVAAIISRKVYRATNNPYLPGIILGIIVTMISCSNTLTWSPV